MSDLTDEEIIATRKLNGVDDDLYKEDKKIEVGEYIRTNKGNIGKIIEIRLGFNKDTQLYQDIYKLDNGLWTVLDYIVKHSKQLIDLIEVKDVIKYRIDGISTTLETKGYVEGIVGISDEEMLQRIKSDKNYHILEILTKEQMMANCYKVGGEDE